MWNEELCKLLATLRFVKSNNDDSMYARLESDGSQTISMDYVDSMLIVGENELRLQLVAKKIEAYVELRIEE